MLKPFKEQMEGFQKRVNEVHSASVKDNTNLTAGIKKVLEVGLKMESEAINLTSALKRVRCPMSKCQPLGFTT
mgnify:CR=1 FL=1